MAHKVFDRVKQISTTTGTGAYSFGAAVDGFRAFSAVFATGDTTFYVAFGAPGSGITAWEAGFGTFNVSGQLERTSVLASSTGSAIDWGAGTKHVAVTDVAVRSFWNLAAGLIKGNGAGQVSAVTLSSFAETILDDTEASAVRATLGLGTAALANTGTADGNVPAFASGGINLEDKVLQRPKLLDIGETLQTISAAASTAIDLTSGNVVQLDQAVNITTFTFNNPPASGTFGGLTIIRVKDNSGTARTIVWPTSVDWPGGTAPTLTQTALAVDIFVFFTIDGGTRWHGAMVSGDSK